MAAASVIGALRRFLPDFQREYPAQRSARRRAIWAITHCRTATMGGHVHACAKCGQSHFAYHSCNHRACPQCGGEATAQWVKRELEKRVGAPYFMVTFTVPDQLRALFFTEAARQIYDVLFDAAAEALSVTLANPRWLGAVRSGFTMILHTWNQRLLFHPHLHCIVPGAGIDAAGRVVSVKSPGFLVPQPVLRGAFRRSFKRRLAELRSLNPDTPLPAVDPAVWEKDWGVHLQTFGDGTRAIQYLGTYVCRTAIADARIRSVGKTTVTFSWKDRARGNARRKETVAGVEFVRRYLRHVLPTSMRAIRRYGFCHPTAKAMRERVAFHTGCPMVLGPEAPPPTKPPILSPCCQAPLFLRSRLRPSWGFECRPP
jgi:hypothetical protein